MSWTLCSRCRYPVVDWCRRCARWSDAEIDLSIRTHSSAIDLLDDCAHLDLCALPTPPPRAGLLVSFLSEADGDIMHIPEPVLGPER